MHTHTHGCGEIVFIVFRISSSRLTWHLQYSQCALVYISGDIVNVLNIVNVKTYFLYVFASLLYFYWLA